ncbi:PRC-barrel domain-containing protein [Nitrosospira multiformis]|uniref:PRC-barrel domain-containing protein n=1 Tax=Nitrosospira multiformis TaxID=1231 RepID=A0A1H8M6G7_9PROT|nr:PRC-barrel domain-containing protein [Nitrosospira multiformis]SEO12943.1 PRC-barrel domain-containing protein [Nitrosospira multiformis]
MAYTDRDTYGMYKNYGKEGKGPGPRLMGADTLIGEDVYNTRDEDLGDIKEIMLDMNNGKIAYAVLSFGGLMGMGDKLFAVPWSALTLDTENKRFILNVDKERLDSAPGFDKDDWPDMADTSWQNTINSYYGTKTYTESSSTKQPTDSPDTPYEQTPYTTTQSSGMDSGRVK